MADQHELGKKGEDWAQKFLLDKGYEIIETNYSYLKAEIDIIAKKDNWMVFVEVKTRYAGTLEGPHQAVGIKKQRQIIKAAHQYLMARDVEEEARFDIIWIEVFPNEKKIEHIEEAFYPGV